MGGLKVGGAMIIVILEVLQGSLHYYCHYLYFEGFSLHDYRHYSCHIVLLYHKGEGVGEEVVKTNNDFEGLHMFFKVF